MQIYPKTIILYTPNDRINSSNLSRYILACIGRFWITHIAASFFPNECIMFIES